MTLFALAFLLPVLLLAGLSLWTYYRRTPRERCKRLFIQIAHHPAYYALDAPKLVNAVNDEDVAYLRAYLKAMGRS